MPVRGAADPMYAACLELEVSGTVAQAVEGALSVEVGGGIPKVETRLTRTEDDLRVDLMSEDLPSLRAAVNSFLRWAAMAAQVAEDADGDGKQGNTYEIDPHHGN
ncbi:MAG: CTAG/PCC1 family protein [Thermoplasmata archaeon]|nr:MAG: CTAG/PCC1 family protein [Thermoplasmata archaeon]